MNSTTLLSTSEGWHAFVTAPSGQPTSMLDDLTPDEQRSLTAWSNQQPRDPGGCIDLMEWPGWETVMARRFKDRFGVALPGKGLHRADQE